MSLILVLLFFLHSSLLSTSKEELHYVNEVLTAGSPWKSPDEEFAFGFYPDSKSSKLNVAIWFENTPANNKTVVWTAGGAQPLLVKRSQAQLKLTSNGFVVDGYWTGPSNVSGVASASLTQDGNLILFDSSHNQLWQSFSSPTDTILPNQQVNVTKTAVLTSQKYSFTVESTKVALSHAVYSSSGYWEEGIENNDTDSTPMLSFTPQGQVMLTAGAGDKLLWSIYPLDFGEVVPRRFHLSSDGNLRILSLHANTVWKVVWQSVLNECEIHCVCGGFGLCTFRPTKVCSCPPGLSMVDVHDETKGCTYNYIGPESLCSKQIDIKFVKVVRAEYFYNDIQTPLELVTLDECEKACQDNCKCLAYLYKYDGTANCYLKGGPMDNGRQTYLEQNILFIKLSAEDKSALDQGVDMFISNTNSSLVPNYTSNLQGKLKEGYLQKSLSSILLAVSILEALLAVGLAILTFVFWKRNTRKLWEKLTAEVEGAPTRFTYKQLRAATANFEKVLGSGAFGTVYKGEIPDKGGEVAVKVIHGATHAEKQFTAEVNTIGKIHHVNLVRLLGYCAEGDHRILVYEYMANSSLDTMLFDKVKTSTSDVVDWETRFLISQGIAKGLAYLHEECQESILHCDIKPQNVLMDVNMCPKISDFGLAKLVKKDHELTVTTVGGTRGYLAPEWLNDQPVTTKADVYSFGMLLFDLLSGREIFKLTPSAIDADEWYFPAWAFQKYAENDLTSIADPKLENNNVDWKQFEMILKVAFWCTQAESSARPSMSKVVQMIDNNVQVPEPPFPRFVVDEQ